MKKIFLLVLVVLHSTHVMNSQEFEFWGWGLNKYKQITDNKLVNILLPSQLSHYSSIKHTYKYISLGETYTMYIREDGTLWAWGSNSNGQLGDGTLEDRQTPVQIGRDTNWVKVICSKYENYEYSTGIKSDGSIWAWGNNLFGQLGKDTSYQEINLPMKVGNSNDWKDFSSSYAHTVAIKKDGTLWAWGFNLNGQLGNGNKINQDSANQISSENKWQMISTGKNHTLALKSDGTIWAWGKNNYGQLGISSYNDSNLPQLIGSDTNWIYVNSGNDFSFAINNKGELWSWGLNNFGQLGISDSLYINKYINKPNKVGNDEWIIVNAGGFHTNAINIEGKVFTWGYNKYGQLGNGTNIDNSQPSNILNGNNWINIQGGSNHTIAVQGPKKLSASITGKFFYLSTQNVNNIAIDINGKFKKTIYSDKDGKFYSIKLPNGKYNITPLPTKDYSFYPENRVIEVNGDDITIGIDFNVVEKRSIAIGIVKNIDNLPIRNVEIKLTGKTDTIATTDSNGVFTFNNLLNGNYTISPLAKANYKFLPDSINFIIEGSNKTNGLDFIATSILGEISGKIIDANNVTIKGIDISLVGTLNKSTRTLDNGTYKFSELPNGKYVVTPIGSNFYSFSPISRTVTLNNNNIQNVDFQALSLLGKSGIIDVSDLNFDKFDIKASNYETKNITIRNLSSSDTLIITGYRNSNPSIFETNLPSQSNQLYLPIKPNGSLQFQTLFKPKDKKVYSDSLIITSTAKTIDSIAYLSGEGIDTIKNSINMEIYDLDLLQSNEIHIYDMIGRNIATFKSYESFKSEIEFIVSPILIIWLDKKGNYHFEKFN